ncbi:MAG: YafY family transcriptional regulator [Ktedonobacteraceae bacterium]|nr:YafY family transcriptional regulator [Ktedonobacteraceae bacterium]
MNRTDRLLAIVLELQGKGWRRAEDLAATFETSKRTIYRDVEALCEAGVPLVSIPGRGYSLMEGYFLPPLSFTTDEATMLLLGSDFMARNFDAQYQAAARSAGRKIEGVLPEQLRAEVHSLQGSIRFLTGGAVGRTINPETLQQVRRAIIERITVSLRYYTRHPRDGRGELSQREVDPYGLMHYLGAWHLVGYCHLRQDIRYFRLDRMEELQLLNRTFQRPATFKIEQRREDEARTITVRVLFDTEVARWVREAASFFVVKQEETAGGLLVTLRIRHESEILQWLLSWGSRVQVLEPASLRARLVEEAERTLSNYRTLIVAL